MRRPAERPWRRIHDLILSSHMRRFALLTLTAMLFAACTGDTPDETPPDTAAAVQPAPKIPEFTYRIVHQYPHDTSAFTQGLVFHEGHFLESTGREGYSSLREVEIETGKVIRRFDLPDSYFAEGLALHGDKLYQLTWKNFHGFVYDLATFRQIDTFPYYGEGWGITTDGTRLIMSDGTSKLRLLKVEDETVAETLDVNYPGGPPAINLNELEWVEGELWANIWTTDRIVRIDPKSGAVKGIIDLTGLLPEQARTGHEDVLNGIAYDPATKRIFVTGKLWPYVFEVQVVAKAA
jgi:glutaminyl-peptide cyclotransferase